MDRVLSGAAIETPSASVNLPLDASLPADYVTEESVRLNLYQRLASVREGPALGDLIGEIEDRFGPPPEPAMNLFYLLSLRIAAIEAGVEEVLMDGQQIVVRFKTSRAVNARELGRKAGIAVEARSNQVRIPVGRGLAWMPHLRELVEALAPTPTAA
jgi:transcription-repair coupling factor (superfamily II helicase)